MKYFRSRRGEERRRGCPHIKLVDVKQFEAFTLGDRIPACAQCCVCESNVEVDLYICTSCCAIWCTHGDPCHIYSHTQSTGRKCSGIVINCADSHVYCMFCDDWLYPRELRRDGEECRRSQMLVENWLQRYGRIRQWWTNRGDPCVNSIGVQGFKNFENTCFFTSTLQCLYHCYPLLREMEKVLCAGATSEISKIHRALISLAVKYWEAPRDPSKPLNPRPLFTSLQNKTATDFTFGVYRDDNMEDSSTLLLDLLNGLTQETLKSTFGLTMTQICSCYACKSQSRTSVQEFTLSLPMLKHQSEENSRTLPVTNRPENPIERSRAVKRKLSIQYENGVDETLNGRTRCSIRTALGKVLGSSVAIEKIAEKIFQYCMPPVPDFRLEDLLTRYFAHETLTDDQAYECDKCQRREFRKWLVSNKLMNPDICDFLLDAKHTVQSLTEGKGKMLAVLGFSNGDTCRAIIRKIKSLQKSKARKCTRFSKPPRILSIQLKRFAPSNGFRIKRHDRIKVPLVLDMSPYIENAMEDVPINYDLFAVNVHEGGMGGGHNMAYVKIGNVPAIQRRHGWWWFSDDKFNTVPFQEVLDSEPYLLFYERRDS